MSPPPETERDLKREDHDECVCIHYIIQKVLKGHYGNAFWQRQLKKGLLNVLRVSSVLGDIIRP